MDDPEVLLGLCRQLIDTHDQNEWGDRTGSFPAESDEHDPSMCGEFGEAIDEIREFCDQA